MIFITTIIWTVVKTKEYPPEELARYNESEPEEEEAGSFWSIFQDIAKMPTTMKQLAWVQFFSWFALFSMWVFSAPAIAQHVFGTAPDDTSSPAFQDAGNWVGVMFTVYNAVSAVFAMVLAPIASKLGRKRTHAISLVCGGVGMLSIYFVPDQNFALVSMALIGIAWASILSIPYSILAGAIPSHKMGYYMGIFNFFIVIPQIVNGIIGGPIVKWVFNEHAIYALVLAGVSFLVAAFCVRFVDDKDEVVTT